MPASNIIIIPFAVPTRIVEVNERRETLTIVNLNSWILTLADDDQPSIAPGDLHGIPLFPYTSLTLERKDGDRPERAWYIYAEHNYENYVAIFEGMTVPTRRWW